MKTPDTSMQFRDACEWRDWLEKHHQEKNEVWLVIYKKKYRHQGLELNSAVEEALCFGWIDSTLNTVDEERYLLRFSPRKEGSIWSIRNIQRAEELMGAGRMTKAGLTTIEKAKENGEWEAARQRERVDIIPEDLESALSKIPGGLEAYRAIPDSRKKQLIYWLQSAKRDETRKRRIKSIIAELSSE